MSIPGTSSDSQTQRYLSAVLAGDAEGATRVVADLLRMGVPRSVVYSKVIGTAMRVVGRLWEVHEISVADEHMASQATAVALARTAPEPPGGGELAAVLCVTPERHGLASQALGALLTDAGYRTAVLSADVPAPALARFVADHRPSLVAVSVKSSIHLPAAEKAIAGLRDLPARPATLIGGDGMLQAAGRLRAAVDLVSNDLGEAADWAAGRRSRARI